MRIASACAAILLLVACGEAATPGTAAPSAAEDNLIECRAGSGSGFERICTVERGESEAGRTLTVRKPDGGFRRLLVAADGRGVVAADGAERARVTILGDDRIEVEIGGDRFRLPATVQHR